MMMQALWLENREITLRDDVPIPRPETGEALVKVHLAGICATDLEMAHGYYPFTGVLGHEFVGQVVEAPGEDIWLGQRVVGEINITCGRCELCLMGRGSHCERRSVLGIFDHDGVFTEYITLPIKNLHRVPDSVSDDAAVFTEPLAAALEIQEQVLVRPTDRVLLIGAGRLGQLVAQTLALTGCNLEVVARRKIQRRLLQDRHITTVSEAEVGENKFDLVVDTSGSPSGFLLAKRAIRARGTIVLKSTYKGEVNTNLSTFVVDEITLVGSRCGPFSPAIRLLEKNIIDPKPLISDDYPLSEGLLAFERAAQPGTLKILLRPH